MKRLCQTLASLMILGFAASPAAASAICERLSFELATLSSRNSPTEQARKYARAIAEQKLSIRELSYRLRKQGCSSGSIVVIGEPARVCTELEDKRERMERNLEILEQKRLAVLAESRTGLSRQRLIAALEENGCTEQPTLVSTPGEDGVSPLVQEHGDGFETIRVPTTEPDYQGSRFVDLGGAGANGSFRTMCVRLCDGGYFPISSRASPINFRRDALVCSMMCPGVKTELFYHAITQESSDMRSAMSGIAYDRLPNAWAFRTRKPGENAECGCNFSLYHKEMLRREAFIKDPAAAPKQKSAITWVKPELRGPTEQAVTVRKAQEERPYEPRRDIRIIGPEFLPDEKIDFMRPVEAAMQVDEAEKTGSTTPDSASTQAAVD